nr:4032_t:CDS:2 [Entrophospora candida]
MTVYLKIKKDKKENESIEAENIPIVVDDEVLESLMKETIVGSIKYMIGLFDVEKALVEWKEKKEWPCNDLVYYDILNITPGSNSKFIKELPSHIKTIILNHEKKSFNFDNNDIKSMGSDMIRGC